MVNAESMIRSPMEAHCFVGIYLDAPFIFVQDVVHVIDSKHPIS